MTVGSNQGYRLKLHRLGEVFIIPISTHSDGLPEQPQISLIFIVSSL